MKFDALVPQTKGTKLIQRAKPIHLRIALLEYSKSQLHGPQILEFSFWPLKENRIQHTNIENFKELD